MYVFALMKWMRKDANEKKKMKFLNRLFHFPHADSNSNEIIGYEMFRYIDQSRKYTLTMLLICL